MEWKDSDKMVDQEDKSEEKYFDEEQYSPWAEQKDRKKGLKANKVYVLIFFLVLSIAALVTALLMLVMDEDKDPVEQQKVANLEEKINQLEERLEKYEAIDEKVTLIWEQAKSFEKFKDRFERSEASTSLRMDHLTMSLEAMQKQFAGQTAESGTSTQKDAADAKRTPTIKYHQVKAGETLYSISKRYGLKVDTLRKMNKMSPNSVIVTGQKLIVRTTAK